MLMPADPPRPSARKLVVLVLLAGGVAAFYLSGLYEQFTWDAVKRHRDAWRGWADGHPLTASAAYFVVYVAITGLSLPVGWVLSVIGGALFDFVRGAVLVSFASATGATL